MIANAYPYGDTGWSLLEQGEINPQTLELDLQGYLIADPSGNTQEGLFSWQEAHRQLALLTGVKLEQ